MEQMNQLEFEEFEESLFRATSGFNFLKNSSHFLALPFCFKISKWPEVLEIPKKTSEAETPGNRSTAILAGIFSPKISTSPKISLDNTKYCGKVFNTAYI